MSTTISRGVRAPIIRKGDDIVAIAVDSVLAAAKQEGFSINEKDVVCVTESVVARADGNFASVDDIAADVRAKFPSGHVGVVFPIQSRPKKAFFLPGNVFRGFRPRSTAGQQAAKFRTDNARDAPGCAAGRPQSSEIIGE